jgi:glycine cleavage system H lipoate-binding protein
MVEIFGFRVPIDDYYLHRGHAWARLEDTGEVRVGLDDFSQKLLGPADEIRLPQVGKVYYQDHLCVALFRQGRRASFEAPLDGAIEAINPKVRQQPRLVHDDPYGEGWLFLARPLNLRRNLDNLLSGEASAAWIEAESQRLLNLMDTMAGVTIPDGGAVIDDLFSYYPEMGWRPTIKEFFLTSLTKEWQKRG